MKPQVTIFGIMLISTLVVAAQVRLQPGEYEIALEIDRTISRGAHYEAGFEKDKKVDCFTAADLKGPAEIAKLFASEADAASCKMSDVKTAGNKMTMTTRCQEGGVQTQFDTEFTFAPDLIAILTNVRDDKGAASTIRITAKRTGECKKP
jgi:hypothetical protein